MKIYLPTQKRMGRVFPVLLNVVMTLIFLIGSTAFPTNARADSTITVNSTADTTTDGDGCTLREAITNARNNAATYGDCIGGFGNDTIVFASSLSTATITLASALPTISDSAGLMIDGDNRITLSGNDSVRVLYVTSGPFTLQNISVTHGRATTGGGLYSSGSTVTITHSVFSNNSATAGSGGGVLNQGIVTITHSTFSNNSATYSGGGVMNNNGTMTITDSAFSNNSAAVEGGGIANSTGTLTIANSTFSNNSAKYGGGLENDSGTATILNSTFSSNSANYGGGVETYQGGSTATTTIRNTILANNLLGGDCWNWDSGILIGGNNIIETTTTCTSIATITSDPNLGSLTSSPAYFPLNADSPAIDEGDNVICAAVPVSNTSQNGLTRPQGAHCDIGSFEFLYKLFLPLIRR